MTLNNWLLLVLLSGLPLRSVAYCIENWACIEDNVHANGVDFIVSNKREYPITVTLLVSSQNLQKKSDNNAVKRDQHRFEVSMVVEGNQKLTLLALTKINRRQRYDYQDKFYWAPGDMYAKHDNVRYLKPYEKGKRFPIVQGFGGRYSHSGASKFAVDFKMPVGTPIHAARGGVVIDKVEKHWRGGASRRYARYANYIVILHDDRTTGEYYHLQQHGAEVEVGQRVNAGEFIGYSGNTGFSSLPHLHFAVYRAKTHGNYESIPFKFKR